MNIEKNEKRKQFDKRGESTKKAKREDKDKKQEEKQKKLKRSELMNSEIEEIEKRINEETPPSGYFVFSEEKKEGDTDNTQEAWKKPKFNFKDLAITKKTSKALSESRFFKMTPIQRATLPHSLAGRDILGASKTGSGKTLCFVIPTLEILFRKKWSSLDGLGALIILPTRELAIQVFEVFKIVGRYHDFSCGLVIGGNNVENEKDSIYKMNIVIGTPGRLLQHVTETPYFNTDNLQLLIIDEVDRILDEGFEANLNEILSYLPSSRQSLLFSATLTKSLKRLAKVNLRSPEYINLNNTDVLIGDMDNPISNPSELILLSKDTGTSDAKSSEGIKKNQGTDNSITPINLKQYYTLVEAHEKIDILFSFLQSHKNSKCLVFLSSCKQVRFFYEVFRRLKLGMLFLDLHGKQKQKKRTNIFYTFLQKKNSVLFATDIASRGVDFPSVDWVIQLDCPEDIQTYIHRVGRTARYKSNGNSILFVNPKEEKFVDVLRARNIEPKKIKINSQKILNLQPVIRAILSENSDLVYTAQRAISSYVKSIFLLKSKEYFDINSINIEKLALSYGLVNMPELKIMKKSQNDAKNKSYKELNALSDDEMDDEGYHTKNENSGNINDQEVNPDTNEVSNSTNENKKKSKLQKLKDKIKMKKMQKAEENAKQLAKEEENDFLKVKRASPEELETSTEKKTKKRKFSTEKDVPQGELENDDEDYYSKIKKRLAVNSESDKIKEKMRILEKHKQDRLNRKQRDYQKHGLLDDEDENEAEESYDENNFDMDEAKEEKEEAKPIKSKKKVHINLNQATLEEKEKAALELLESDDNIFV